MADPVTDPQAGAKNPSPPPQAPAELTPSPAPAVASPAVTETPPVAAPVAAPPPAVPEPVVPLPTPPAKADGDGAATPQLSLLEEFDKKAKEGTESAKAPAAKAAETKPAEAPAPAPETPPEYKFEIPESLKVDDERMNALTAAFVEAKLPSELGGALGQKLLTMHADAMARYDEQLRQEQLAVFAETRKGWRTEVLADPEFGGSGHNTAMTAIARARDLLVSSAKPGSAQYLADMKAHEDFMTATGAGDHPAYLRMLHNAARFVDEPQFETVPQNIKPTSYNGRPPGSFKEVMYDNPRSNANGRG